MGAILGLKYFVFPGLPEKIYVAVEGDGKIAVIDPVKQVISKYIDLAVEHEGGELIFAPHNIQVAPDGKSVWVTANVVGHSGHSTGLIPRAQAHGEETGSAVGDPDEIIIIDPFNDRIIKRVPIGLGVHLAHVVVNSSGTYAYFTAQNEGAIYKFNAQTYKIEKEIKAPEKSEPHGLRLSPDKAKAYIALLKGKGLGILDLSSDELSIVPLRGSAVQTGIAPDGKYVVASLYDTKELAVYNVSTKEVKYISLPGSAKGPIQMYSDSSSRFVYMADQGYYYNQPEGDTVYKIDLIEMKVVKEIKGGRAPHGGVVSKDGARVYVTNLLGGDVSVINALTDSELKRITVGREPNGVSIWYKDKGGTP